MSCHRAREIDPAAFLLDPRSSSFDAFRAHYPGCEDCARAVAEWSRVEIGLRSLGDGAHPEPEQLAAFQRARTGEGPMGAEERRRIDEHLSGCVACRDELRALRGFSPAALAEPAGPGAEPATPTGGGPAGPSGGEAPGPGAPPRRPWWRHPAFAPALAASLLGVLLLPLLSRTPEDVPSLAPATPPAPEATAPRSVEPLPQPAARVRRETPANDALAGAVARDSDLALEEEIQAAPAPLRIGGGTPIALAEARAARKIRVALPPDFGRARARVVPEPSAATAAEGSGARVRESFSMTAPPPSGASAAGKAAIGSMDDPAVATVQVDVPIAGPGFAGAGLHRIEVESLDAPGRPPRVYHVEVR